MSIQDWNDERRIIQEDVQNYYVYVPAFIIYHDANLRSVHNKLPQYIQQRLWLGTSEKTGRQYSKMTMGLALIHAPFIAITHYLILPLTNYPATGYSPPYKITLLICSLIFLFLGLFYLRKVSLRYYSDYTSALLILIVGLGTNLTWYVTTEPVMSHVYSFALILMFYDKLQDWLIKPGFKNTVLMGLLFGLIVLIRPTNIIVGFLILASAKPWERIKFLIRKYQYILLMIAAYLVIWAPQLAFWKIMGGSWFMYTYGDEGFFFNNPQIISSLTSYRNGWLVYTPLMALSFIGLPILWKLNREHFWQVLTLLALFTFVNSSWWCWWFGGSFGNRAYIDGYGIFALSIGAVLHAVSNYRIKVVTVFVSLLITAFSAINILQTWQYRVGMIHYDSNTKETFWMHYLRTKPNPDYFNRLIKPDYESSKKGIYFSKNEITEEALKELRKKEALKRNIRIR